MVDQIDGGGIAGGRTIDWRGTNIIMAMGQMQQWLPLAILESTAEIETVDSTNLETELIAFDIPADTVSPGGIIKLETDLYYSHFGAGTVSFTVKGYLGTDQVFTGTWTVGTNAGFEHLFQWWLICSDDGLGAFSQLHKVLFTHATLGIRAAPVAVATGAIETGAVFTAIDMSAIQTLRLTVQPSVSNFNVKANRAGYTIQLTRPFAG